MTTLWNNNHYLQMLCLLKEDLHVMLFTLDFLIGIKLVD